MPFSDWHTGTRMNMIFDHQRVLEQLTRETSSYQRLLDYEHNTHRAITRLWGHDNHLRTVASLAQMNPPDTALTLARFTDRMYGHELHANFSKTTRFAENADTWAEIQRSIAGVSGRDHPLSWIDITRLTDAMMREQSTMRQLSRICDFDRGLRAAMLEPAHVAWSAHLRTTALPTLSFLAQDWLKPLALMTDLAPFALGASVSWLTRQSSATVVMTAAITPTEGRRRGIEVIVEEEILCALCDSPILNFDGDVKWIGPRRAVRQRFIFPACPTCSAKERQEPGFLQHALRELERPRFAVIRGGRKGDGHPQGQLRLVQNDSDGDGPGPVF